MAGWMEWMKDEMRMRWDGTHRTEQNSNKPKLVVEGIGLTVLNLIIEFNHCSSLDILAFEMFYSNWNGIYINTEGQEEREVAKTSISSSTAFVLTIIFTTKSKKENESGQDEMIDNVRISNDDSPSPSLSSSQTKYSLSPGFPLKPLFQLTKGREDKRTRSRRKLKWNEKTQDSTSLRWFDRTTKFLVDVQYLKKGVDTHTHTHRQKLNESLKERTKNSYNKLRCNKNAQEKENSLRKYLLESLGIRKQTVKFIKFV